MRRARPSSPAQRQRRLGRRSPPNSRAGASYSRLTVFISWVSSSALPRRGGENFPPVARRVRAPGRVGQTLDGQGERATMQAIEAVIKGLDAVINRVLIVCKWLTISTMGTLFVIMVAGVFFRYVVNSALPWYEEASKYMMVWMTFMAAPIALKQGGNAGVQVLHNLLPGRIKQFNWLIIFTITGIVVGMLLWHGTTLAWFARNQTPSSFDMPFIYVYMCMPIGALIMMFIVVEFWLRSLLSFIAPQKYFFTGGVMIPGLTDQDISMT
ncbi:MAG: TRAP transporter small permease [Alphaproteobacteria bacterium]|nr:TRAP transporter small permease [Alphaproteobacteria bacterium]